MKRRITIQGNGNIYIGENRLIVNGVPQDFDAHNEPITVIIEGNCNNITAEGSVEVKGSCKNVDCGGSASIGGDVFGDVDAGGSVRCGNISGDVDAGGSVRCEGMKK